MKQLLYSNNYFIVVVFICNEGEKEWKIILNGRITEKLNYA